VMGAALAAVWEGFSLRQQREAARQGSWQGVLGRGPA
jgi:hypothetical protein